VISVWLEVDDSQRDLLIADLWEAGTAGITEASGSVRAFFNDDADAEMLRTRFGSFHPVVESEEDRDWVKDSRAHWQPIAVGERFYLVPEWRDDAAPCGRIRLRTYPGMACGTGAHPCTQLCLEAMERHLPQDGRVLDIGTGSGILAQAAHLLGAEDVFACDIDHEASMIAKENFAKSPYRIPLFTGSARSVRTRCIRTVIANVNATTLDMIRDEIRRIAAEDAILILSGFHEDETPRVVPQDFAILLTLERDGWACVVLSAKA
jgi:ribosomal protein L11 methyltransferase